MELHCYHIPDFSTPPNIFHWEIIVKFSIESSKRNPILKMCGVCVDEETRSGDVLSEEINPDSFVFSPRNAVRIHNEGDALLDEINCIHWSDCDDFHTFI